MAPVLAVCSGQGGRGASLEPSVTAPTIAPGTHWRNTMNHLRDLSLGSCLRIVPFGAAGDKGKATDNTWAKIISGLLTPEHSKKGLALQENAAVKPDTILSYAAKDLGAKLSLKMIQEKYGKPSKTEE